jgi:hypothetical protein
MAKTKVKSDEKGLFVITGGWVGRPRQFSVCSEQTSFKVGDEVKSHHFRGSTIIGVGDKNCNFRKRKGYELWWIDCLSPEVKKVMEKSR